MNKAILMGRLTRDPEIRYSSNDNSKAIARYTLAVDRRYNRDQEQQADFINCVAFGKSAEVAEKYFRKGTKLVVTGHIQTGSYTNKEGQKVYTTDVIIEDQEFAESKGDRSADNTAPAQGAAMNAPVYGQPPVTNPYNNTGGPVNYQQGSNTGNAPYTQAPATPVNDAPPTNPWDNFPTPSGFPNMDDLPFK